MGLKNAKINNVKSKTISTQIANNIKTKADRSSLASNFSDMFRWGIFLHATRKMLKGILISTNKNFISFFKDVLLHIETLEIQKEYESLKTTSIQARVSDSMNRYLNKIPFENRQNEYSEAVSRFTKFILEIDEMLDINKSDDDVYDKVVNIYALSIIFLFEV